jgi:hypothetical protein
LKVLFGLLVINTDRDPVHGADHRQRGMLHGSTDSYPGYSRVHIPSGAQAGNRVVAVRVLPACLKLNHQGLLRQFFSGATGAAAGYLAKRYLYGCSAAHI